MSFSVNRMGASGWKRSIADLKFQVAVVNVFGQVAPMQLRLGLGCSAPKPPDPYGRTVNVKGMAPYTVPTNA